MVKAFYRYFLLLLVVTLSATCDTHEFPASPYPNIETLPVADVTESGVTLHGNITRLAAKPLTNHGFVFGSYENVTFGSAGSDKMELGNVSSVGEFAIDVNTGWTKGSTYYVRAFAATDTYIIYGKSVSFVSKGSTPAVIDAFEPNEGVAGDTLLIKGKYFSPVTYRNTVRMGGINALILKSSDSTILCVVPGLEAGKSFSAAVETSGQTTISKGVFNVLVPSVKSMDPLSGTFRDIITVTGDHFAKKKEYFEVKLGGVVCQDLVLQSNKLSFRVPDNLTQPTNDVTVKISGVTIAAGQYKLNAPSIESVSNAVLTAYTNPPITISGTNFSSQSAANMVMIGDRVCTVTASSVTSLTVSIPSSLISDRDLSVRDTLDLQVKVLGQSVIVKDKIIINYLSKWTRMRDFPGSARIYGASFSMDGMGYVGLGASTGSGAGLNDMWKYNPTTDEWTRLPDFPGTGRSSFATLVFNSKVYIIAGATGNRYVTSNRSKEVWEFNPGTNAWTRKNDFPGVARYGAFGFVANNVGYIGGGNVSATDFWKYNDQNDTWTQLKNLTTTALTELTGMSDGSTGYMLDYQCCGQRNLWKYNQVADSWIDMPNAPGSYPEQAAFLLNGKFNVLGGDSNYYGSQVHFVYDLAANAWASSTFKAPSRKTASSFVIGDYGYLMLGRSECDCANLKDVWRYDPSKP